MAHGEPAVDQDQGEAGMTRPPCLSQRETVSHTAVPPGHNAHDEQDEQAGTRSCFYRLPLSQARLHLKASVHGADSTCDAVPFCCLWKLNSGPRLPGADSEAILPSSKLDSWTTAHPTAGQPVPRPPLSLVLALIPPPGRGPSEGSLTLLCTPQGGPAQGRAHSCP